MFPAILLYDSCSAWQDDVIIVNPALRFKVCTYVYLSIKIFHRNPQITISCHLENYFRVFLVITVIFLPTCHHIWVKFF